MSLDERGDTIGVAHAETVEDLPVLVDGVTSVGHLGERHVPHPVGLRGAHGERVGRVAGGGV